MPVPDDTAVDSFIAAATGFPVSRFTEPAAEQRRRFRAAFAALPPDEAALIALAAFDGVRIEPIAAGAGLVEARLHLPAAPPHDMNEAPRHDERHRGRAALYALATVVELAMRDVDVWWTSVYFHDGAAEPGFRGSIIIDCGGMAKATALAMVRGLAERLAG